MTRRRVGGRAIAVVALLIAAATPALGYSLLEAPSDARDLCQPDPALLAEQAADIVAGVDPTPQRLTCRYGPLVVTPGDNLILFGPVTIESPRVPGYITRFAPDLVDALTGEVPPIHRVHLHHGVWLNASGSHNPGTPFFATGEEKTVSSPPSPYGYRTMPTDTWVANYMLHNLTAETHTVFITYELDWIPWGSTRGGEPVTPVEPLWFDVVGGIYPVYDAIAPSQIDEVGLQRGGKRPTDSVPSFDDFELQTLPLADRVTDFDPAPSGRATVRENLSGFTGGPQSGAWRLVWVGGHVHPGGLRDELVVGDCNGDGAAGPDDEVVAFTSDALLNPGRDLPPDERQFGSWDFLMTASRPGYDFVLHGDQPVTVRTYYDAANPWYEAMGIMFAWGVPLTDADAAQLARCDTSRAGGSGAVTRPAPPDDDALVFGGPWGGSVGTDPVDGPPVERIDIAAFTYSPGGGDDPPAVVRPGSTVRFRNVDAYAGVYHSVTTCAPPCNQPWGQSYPLPELGYDVDGDPTTPPVGGFDSGELGWGVPFATAAANTDTFDYTVPRVPDGTRLTYYCRIHPQMRATLVVERGGE